MNKNDLCTGMTVFYVQEDYTVDIAAIEAVDVVHIDSDSNMVRIVSVDSDEFGEFASDIDANELYETWREANAARLEKLVELIKGKRELVEEELRETEKELQALKDKLGGRC